MERLENKPENSLAIAEYRIAEWNLAPLEDKLAKLVKRAKFLGLPPVTVEVIGREKAENEGGLAFDWLTIRVAGQAPVIAGYSFVGTLQHEPEGNIFYAVPGETLSEDFRHVATNCDHCQKSRWRRDTFVVKEVATGQLRQIGRNCLRDFLGHTDPQKLAAYVADLEELEAFARDAEKDADPYVGTGLRGGIAYDLLEVLGHTVAVMAKEGWLSRGSAREYGKTATADRAVNNMRLTDLKARGLLKTDWRSRDENQPLPVTREQWEEAEAALAWLREVSPRWYEGNDYRTNLYYVAKKNHIEPREVGTAASLIPVYRKERQAGVEREVKAEAASPNSDYFGQIGKRADFTLTLVGITETEGNYGATYIHRFTDEAGNVAIWFGSTRLENVVEGGQARVKATVSDHKEYNGVRQTYLKRVALVEVIGASCNCQAEQEAYGYAGRAFNCPKHGWKEVKETPEKKAERLAEEAAAKAEQERGDAEPTEDAKKEAVGRIAYLIQVGVGDPNRAYYMAKGAAEATRLAALESYAKTVEEMFTRYQAGRAVVADAIASGATLSDQRADYFADRDRYAIGTAARDAAEKATRLNLISADQRDGVSGLSWRADEDELLALVAYLEDLVDQANFKAACSDAGDPYARQTEAAALAAI